MITYKKNKNKTKPHKTKAKQTKQTKQKLTCLEKQERLQGKEKKTEQTFVADLQLLDHPILRVYSVI